MLTLTGMLIMIIIEVKLNFYVSKLSSQKLCGEGKSHNQGKCSVYLIVRKTALQGHIFSVMLYHDSIASTVKLYLGISLFD